jgi:hypothetical protein
LARDRHRIDLDHDAHFARLAERIAVFAEIFLGERIDMRVGPVLIGSGDAAPDL